MSGLPEKFREICSSAARYPPRAVNPASASEPNPCRDIETWAERYVLSTSLNIKLAPPAPPKTFRGSTSALRLTAPGRPPELRAAKRGERTPKQEALEEPYYRARTLHAFLHHELQAAELMCWAILAFPEAEQEFRRGLLGICLDEIRHMNLYAQHIAALGCKVGDFGVRDWFWKRVPSCRSKLEFVAVLGMGLEAANLEYAPNFAARFRLAGDEPGACIQEQIAAEEVAHVGFATRWFARWTGGCDFADWLSHLPPPLSPWVMHGRPIAHDARRRAGMSDAFLQALESYVPEPKGRAAAELEPG
jgi:uncharacterized ferritin-like protein (DUF455 family)